MLSKPVTAARHTAPLRVRARQWSGYGRATPGVPQRSVFDLDLAIRAEVDARILKSSREKTRDRRRGGRCLRLYLRDHHCHHQHRLHHHQLYQHCSHHLCHCHYHGHVLKLPRLRARSDTSNSKVHPATCNGADRLPGAS